MHKLSIVGKGYHTDEHVVVSYYNTGDRMGRTAFRALDPEREPDAERGLLAAMSAALLVGVCVCFTWNF